MISKMKEMLEVQGQDGNWNYDEYMHGMYNGMEFMLSMAEDREPVYKDKPKQWLEGRRFLVQIEGENPIVVNVKDDVNRPNNMDCHSVLEAWKTDNYGYKPYDYYEIDTCEKHNI